MVKVRRAVVHALVPGLAVTSGCRSCRDHPYVPYSIASADATPSASSTVSSSTPGAVRDADALGDPFAARDASSAPPATSHWEIDDAVLDAPEGLVFVSALVADFDGDGVPEAFAIARPADGNDPGEVLYFRGPRPGPLAVAATFAPPPGLSRTAGCVPIDRLEAIGARSVLAELGASCAEHATLAPARWLAVIAGGATATVRLAVTLVDPPGAPTLTLQAAAVDRDGDGRDDIALRVTLEGGGPPLEPGPRVSATLAWLDRPAGLSRDSAATDASFAALASAAMAHALRAKEAPEVPEDAAQVRALWRASCAEGGSPRIVPVAGTGTMACGSTRALEEIGLAEVRAYATLGDPLRAALAFDRAERPPATRTASRVAEAQKWITPLAPTASARLLRAVAAVPLARKGHAPAWGALAFEPAGKLLVRTRAGVVRIDPDLGDEAAANVRDWDARVTSPDGAATWIEAYDPCDGLPLRATFELASGSDARDLALPIAPPLAARCAGARGAPVQATPVAWGSRGLEALVEGALILVPPDLGSPTPLATFLDQPAKPGAPRSPDGNTVVVPTDVGFIVRRDGRARLLRGSELDGTYGEQHDCAVSNDTTHVACVRAGRAWVGTWDAP